MNALERVVRKHSAELALLTLGLLLHGAYMARHSVNTDEPQHLHVAWSVSQGMLPYRDVFDNHSPLFSLLMAPAVGKIGERADIVLLSRLLVVPFFLLTLWLVWRMGIALGSRRDALWAVGFTMLVPDFMLGSVEYRTDQLWASASMAALAVLVTGRASPRRAFFFGALLGVAIGASMKTSLLAFSLAAALLSVTVMGRSRPTLGRLTALLGAAVAGLAVVPGALFAYFAWNGAIPQFLYGTVGHNIVPGLSTWRALNARALLLPISFPLLLVLARRIQETEPDPSVGARKAVLFLTGCVYYLALLGLWPMITRQDYLPFIPLATVVLAPYLMAAPQRLHALSARLTRKEPSPVQVRMFTLPPALLVAFMVGKAQTIEPVWAEHGVRTQTAFLSEVIRTTRPEEPVMDLRGETIFRRRPFFYALEAVTQVRLQKGLIRDSIPERLAETRTPAAVVDTPLLPCRGRKFLDENYLRVGALRFAGKEIGAPDALGNRIFEIEVPQRYALVSECGSVTGLLDGETYRGPRELTRGTHVYRGEPRRGRVAVLWSEAIARAGSPFPEAAKEIASSERMRPDPR